MLTNILLILITAAAAGYGYYLTFRLDRWVGEEKKLQADEEQNESQESCAVVFGGDEWTEETGGWLKSRGLRPVFIEEACLKKDWKNVSLVIAISSSDEDNLSVCNLLRKIYHTEQLYGICNDQVNYIVYKRFHIQVLNRDIKITEQLENAMSGNEVVIA